MPRQHSSGGRDRLGSISKQGDRYLRSLFVAGALAVIRYAKLHGTKYRAELRHNHRRFGAGTDVSGRPASGHGASHQPALGAKEKTRGTSHGCFGEDLSHLCDNSYYCVGSFLRLIGLALIGTYWVREVQCRRPFCRTDHERFAKQAWVREPNPVVEREAVAS